jgi:Putative beta-barrel porin-2, OmpL-like. bbp2
MWLVNKTLKRGYMVISLKRVLVISLFTLGLSAFGQTPTPAPPPPDAQAPPAAPTPLSTPAITGPLANLPPAMFGAGPFGNIAVNGILSGMGMVQSNRVPGDDSAQRDLSNGQIFIQKADGWFQFYLQAGAYNIPSLGVPFLATDKTATDLYGPLPLGFVKFQAGKNTSIQAGILPTMIGAEYTFTFENMNINRGLLWNQENVITRGIQVNQAMGKFSASLALTDGFYSDRYNWLTGSLAYTNGPNAISFVAGGNMGQTKFDTIATPVQNNGSIYNIIYTYTKGSLILQPYFQYTDVPTNAKIGVVNGASTTGGAILASYAFKHGFSLPVRFEYISSSGSLAKDTVNLLYGPGSAGTSFTVTPTFQNGGFFVRGDLSLVHASSFAKGDVFGNLGTNDNQFRAAIETGFMFGNNIEKKP